jgi:hypothetical protein
MCGFVGLCSLGLALTDALDELIQSGHINPQLALAVLKQVRESSNLSPRCCTRRPTKETEIQQSAVDDDDMDMELTLFFAYVMCLS